MKTRNKLLFWIVGICLIGTMLLTAFSRRISGKVIDASTGAPIAEAIVLAQWTVTHGIGDHSHTVSKITEVLTDDKGIFIIWGPFNPFADPPQVVILKEDYIAWRNDYTFPGYVHNLPEGTRLSNYDFKLERIKGNFSWLEYSSFIDLGIMPSVRQNTPRFYEALDKISSEAYRRANIQIPLRFDCKVVDDETGKPIKGAVLVAVGQGLGYTPGVNTVSEGISDKQGTLKISGTFPMLERPPSVILYKKGYGMISSWGVANTDASEQLNQFKWQTGFIFKMEKRQYYKSPPSHYAIIYHQALDAQRQGKYLLIKALEE